MMRLFVFCSFLCGCAIPISTGVPNRIRAVGKKQAAIGLQIERPLASVPGVSSTDLMAFRLHSSVGLSKRLDFDFAMEGAVDYVPIPLGGSVGLRFHILDHKSVDLGVHSRLGALASPFESTENDQNEREPAASAFFASFGGGAQWKLTSWLQPIIALNVIRASLTYPDIDSAESLNTSVFINSITLGATVIYGDIEFTPFFQTTVLHSPIVSTEGSKVTAGVSVGIRGLAIPDWPF